MKNDHFICVIDNDAETREMLAALFAGKKTVCFSSGTAALKYLAGEDGGCCCVILDLSMPTLDGLTVAQEIRRNENLRPENKRARLIFYTGQIVDEVIVSVAERTRARIVQKGDIDRLIEEVENR